MNDFRECHICAQKKGDPVLCASCRYNRDTIDELKRYIHRLQDIYAAANVLEFVAESVENGVPHKPGWLKEAVNNFKAAKGKTNE